MLPRRILRRFIGVVVHLRCPLKVFVGHLKVMFLRHCLGVTDPCADDMLGPFLRQFCLTSAAEVLKEFGPWLESRLGDDPLKLRPQVASA